MITVVVIVLIGIAGYKGFSPLFDKFESGVTGQFFSAIFGTIITILLTIKKVTNNNFKNKIKKK